MQIKQYTEDSLTLILGESINPETNRVIVNLDKWIKEQNIPGVTETVVSFTQLLIYFDPFVTNKEKLTKTVETADLKSLAKQELTSNVIEIPVCYEGEFAPDIALFEENGLSPQEVVKLHANKEYLVYMLGFMPGFVYLGGLDERLYKARLNNPRASIPAGSVGIGGEQTGMYPFESPGGWNLIGRTPVRLYDIRRGDQAILYNAGDRIVFRPISLQRYQEIEKEVDEGIYQVKIRKGADS